MSFLYVVNINGEGVGIPIGRIVSMRRGRGATRDSSVIEFATRTEEDGVDRVDWVYTFESVAMLVMRANIAEASPPREEAVYAQRVENLHQKYGKGM
jgi:hypothetical protein